MMKSNVVRKLVLSLMASFGGLTAHAFDLQDFEPQPATVFIDGGEFIEFQSDADLAVIVVIRLDKEQLKLLQERDTRLALVQSFEKLYPEANIVLYVPLSEDESRVAELVNNYEASWRRYENFEVKFVSPVKDKVAEVEEEKIK